LTICRGAARQTVGPQGSATGRRTATCLRTCGLVRLERVTLREDARRPRALTQPRPRHSGDADKKDESPAHSRVRPAGPDGSLLSSPEPPVIGREKEPLRHVRESVWQVAAAPSHRDTVDRRAPACQARVTATPRGGDRPRKRTGRRSVARVPLARKPPRSIAWVSTPLPRETFGPGILTSTRQSRFLKGK